MFAPLNAPIELHEQKQPVRPDCSVRRLRRNSSASADRIDQKTRFGNPAANRRADRQAMLFTRHV